MDETENPLTYAQIPLPHLPKVWDYLGVVVTDPPEPEREIPIDAHCVVCCFKLGWRIILGKKKFLFGPPRNTVHRRGSMKKGWSLASGVLALLLGTSISAGELTIATFNAEFLTRPKVHMKFGFPFNLSGPDKVQWDAPGFRDRKFNEAAKAVARVIAGISADVVALTEVGNRQDVLELVNEIEQLGLRYDHIAVCNCTDHTTQQHVAVLSKLQLSEVLISISGRESYDRELDDPETEDDTGLSKGLFVTFQAEGKKFNLYVVHLASERKGHEQDAQRIAQASIIRRHYLPVLNAGEHVIVAGDLNDHRG